MLYLRISLNQKHYTRILVNRLNDYGLSSDCFAPNLILGMFWAYNSQEWFHN